MILNALKFAKIAVILPAVTSGLVIAPTTSEIRTQPFVSVVSQSTDAQPEASPESAASVAQLTVNRRVRVERILVELNRVAEVSMQMEPERSEALEPVVMDLAERAMELTAKETVSKASTETKLSEIEGTVERLMKALRESVEPEMAL